MKSIRRNVCFLVLAILAISCAVAERHRETITRTWPAQGIRRIDVHEVNGSVDVVSANVPEISLVAKVSARDVPADAKKENKGYFESSVEGDTLTIGRHGRRNRHVSFPFFFGNDVTVSYELRVPQSVALELNTVNGRIETHGTSGETNATTVNGVIDLESSGGGEVTAHTVNGSIKAKFLQGFQGARFKTVNGSVYASLPPTASFDCDVSQVNGDFEASFPLSIHSHPGRRRVSGNVNGGRYELRIVTVNGDVEVATAAGAVSPATLPPVPAPPQAPPVPQAPKTE